MRRLLFCLVLLLPDGALGADPAWTAQLEEDEGGPVMVASVEATPGEGELIPRLRLMCGGSDRVVLRYETPTEGAGPDSEADFLFENEISQVTKHLAYEDMDGAFAGDFPLIDPIFDLLRTGADVTVSASTGNFPAQAFSLKGSSKAIAALLKTCR